MKKVFVSFWSQLAREGTPNCSTAGQSQQTQPLLRLQSDSVLARIVHLAGGERMDGWRSEVWKQGSGHFPYLSQTLKAMITLEGQLNTKGSEERSLKIFLFPKKHSL